MQAAEQARSARGSNVVIRQAALDRHALTRHLERRERWLEKAGITPAQFKQAVDALAEALHATKLKNVGRTLEKRCPMFQPACVLLGRSDAASTRCSLTSVPRSQTNPRVAKLYRKRR